jgi:hypothetical protein
MRTIAAVVVTLLAVVLAAMAVDGFWLHDRVFNTEHFVESLAPLPQDPAISTAIATKTVEVLGSGGTAESKIAEVMPDRLAFLAPRVMGLVEEQVYDATAALVASDAFSAIWIKGLEALHSRIIGILDGDPVQPTEGAIGIKLEGSAELVQAELDKRGIDLFAEVETKVGEIVFIQAEMLAGPRELVNVFHTAVWVLPIVALLVFGLAVLIDKDRLRPIQFFGFGLAIAVLLSLAGVRIFAGYAGGEFENEVYREGAAAVWDALLNGYLLMSAIVGFIALVVGLAAWWFRRAAAPAESAES